MLQKIKNKNKKVSLLERIGLGLSFACALHCIATPLLLAFLPLASSTLAHSHELDLILIVSSFVIVGFTNLVGFIIHHKQYAPLVYMLLGFSLVVSGHVTEIYSLQLLLGILGGLFVAISIVLNKKAKDKKKQIDCSCVQHS